MARVGMLSDALQQGCGQDAGMNVDGTGCTRECASRMWAWTGGNGSGACCWGGKPSSMNVTRMWVCMLWEQDSIEHGRNPELGMGTGCG